jgi:hypothetical protein
MVQVPCIRTLSVRTPCPFFHRTVLNVEGLEGFSEHRARERRAVLTGNVVSHYVALSSELRLARNS